ncbi:MAG: ABC transporter ATP-binding protein [Alphaproteobacteria bacterium]
MMSDVLLESIKKSYGDVDVIHGVDLAIEAGEFVVFVGPSGCGKSTLLRMIAGLEEISGGTLSIGGQEVNDVPPAKRNVSMVFQSYALYPHMSVYKNLAFGLKMAKVPEDEIKKRVKKASEILQLEPYLERTPKALSGGQRQRVAIGRAIVRDPLVFLFDEPLSNLDAALRNQTRVEIAKLHQRLGTTMIYVTHDQVEAMTLADRIVVLNGGNIEQVGSPMELYQTPANKFVAGFIGSPQMNFVSCASLPDALKKSGAIEAGIRPEHLRLSDAASAPIRGELELIEQLGEFAQLHVRIDQDNVIIAKVVGTDMPKIGAKIAFDFDQTAVIYFDADGKVVA